MKRLLLLALVAPAIASAQIFPSPTFTSLTLQSPLTAANGGTGATTATGSGSVVLSTSPALTTPNLGIPSAVTLTNGIGLPISTGVSGLGTGVAAGLANAVTGSGSPVLATSPTITTPTISGGTGSFTTLSATTANPSLNYQSSGTGAVERTYSSKLGDYISIADFGAVCNGSTDDTTAIQNAWNEGEKEQKNVRISGVGTGVCKITSLTMPLPTSGNGGQSVLFGDNPNSTTLLSNVTGSTCAINITGTWGSTGSFLGKMGGFTLYNSNSTPSGNGFCLAQIADFTLTNYQVGNFNAGEYAVDAIWINNDHCLYAGNNVDISGNYGSLSHPNNWNIGPACLFHNTNQYPLYFQNGGVINVFGNDFEHNGVVSGPNIFGVVWMNGNPSDGSKGLTMWGNYIEDNGYASGGSGTGFSAADVVISDNGGTNPGSHHVFDNLFNRTISGTSNINIWLDNTTSGTGLTTLTADSNAFSEDFTPGTGTANIYVNNATTNNWSLSCNDNQVGHPTQEMQFVPCKPKQLTSPGWTLVDGTYHEFGTVTATTTGAAVTFPVACPNAVATVSLTGNNGSTPASFSVGGISLTGFTAYASTSAGASWTAICH